MSKSIKSILLWDFNCCPANSTENLSQIMKLLKYNFTSIVCLAKDHSQFPPDLSDLSTLLPITMRYGVHSLHDSIVDVVYGIGQAKKFNFVLISNEYNIWMDLFQKLPPSNIVFISKNDPRQSLPFSFLPEKISYQVLHWPSLNELGGQTSNTYIDENDESDEPQFIKKKPFTQQRQAQDDDDDDNDDVDDDMEEDDEENAESSFSSSKNNSPRMKFQKQRKHSPTTDKIKPLSNLEKHQIDLRSPVGSKSDKNDNKFKPQGRDNNSFPLEFQPLIEAMKSIGKSMISKSDLEEQFSICCKNLNLPPQDLMSMIDKASSYGLIIYDSSINYVRFKNRQLANANITYV